MALLRLIFLLSMTAFEVGGRNVMIDDCFFYAKNNATYDLLWFPKNIASLEESNGKVFFSSCPEKPHENCHNSSVCVVKDDCKVFYGIKDAGVRYDDGYLEVVYEAVSGLGCGGGVSKVKQIQVIYRCSDDFELAYSSNENEAIEIMWKSPVGCPVTEDFSIENSCLFNSKEFTYDLRSLKNLPPLTTPYGDSKELLLNLCGGTSCPHRASFCERNTYSGAITSIFAPGLPFFMNVRGNQLSLRGQTWLSYTFPTGQLKVEFHCDNTLKRSVITGFRKNDSINSWVFDVNSTLACPIKMSPCKYEFLRGTYDLSSLTSLRNRRLTRKDDTVILNICQPLTYETGLPCTGENVFGCLHRQNTTVRLGTHVQVNESSNGLQLTLEGSACSENINYTTYIDLICSNDNKEPTLRELRDCKIRIEWINSAGCPTQYFKGDNCAVNHPFLSESKLNLTRLFRRGAVSVYIPPLRSNFSINLCSSLTTCGTAENVTICMIGLDNPLPVPVGYFPVELIASHGVVQFKSFGSPCRSDASMSRTIINLKCHFESTDLLKFISEDRCSVILDWFTSHACPYERNSVPCSVYDRENGMFYDLSRLALTEGNYIARVNDTVRLEFNMCQNMVPVGCQYETDVCLVDRTDPLKPRFREVGLKGAPRMTGDNHNVLLWDEMSCEEFRYSTVFNITCGSKQTSPSVELKGCSFYVRLTAPEACPVKVVGINNCKFENLFDLSSLAAHDWSTLDGAFKLSVCGSLSGLKNHSSGASIVSVNSESEIFGYPNSPLLLDKQTGSPYLNYSADHVFSLIYFACGEETGPVDYWPKYLSGRPTTHYTFTFSTPRVCRYSIDDCCANVPYLCPRTDHFYVNANGKRVILGMCKSQTICNGSLACTSDKSLGRFLKEPSTDSDGTVSLVYSKGDVCGANNSEKMSTVLLLKCAQSLKETEEGPLFSEIKDGCQYIFKWESHLFCRQAPTIAPSPLRTEDCQTIAKEPRLRQIFGMHHLDYELTSGSGRRYAIDLCSPRNSLHSPCLRSLCAVNADGSRTPTGHTFASVLSNDHDLVINYLTPNKTCKCSVKFLCNQDAYLGEPTIFKESSCDIEIIWETQLFCPTLPVHILNNSNSSSWLLWTSILSLVAILGVAVGAILLMRRRRCNYPRFTVFGGRGSIAGLLSESNEAVMNSENFKLD